MRPWMSLDNAALIFPATQNSRWVNTFRLSADLAETVDPALLGQAVKDLMPRFPTVYVRLGRGLFWYYLQAVEKAPDVIPEYAYPLTHMSRREQKRCCFRVLYHENRIAVERKNFNEVAKDYNTMIRKFPQSILAGMFGFEKRPYFTASEEAQSAPQVQF